MTKEELLELGLTEEQIPQVFKINGIDVEKAKGDLTTKETELADAKKLLDDANKEIEGFKDLDVEGIKKASQDYKEKYEKAQLDAQEELEKVKFEHELEGAIRDSKAKNITAVKALLDIEALRGSNNRLDDIKQAIESTKTENDFLFGDSEPVVKGRQPNNSGGTPKTDGKLKSISEMSYKELTALKQNNPEAYESLIKE